ncbi:hypothetical protein QCA50_004187 [Cerrena zonata]|uniref:Mediator complex subunit 1 n=1 Tax=Cerrena zonata TaxID=2478898 RepID=A0AAW0GIR5_9APHY
MASTSSSSSTRTAQSALQDFRSNHELPQHSLHPFSASPEATLSSLRGLVDLTGSIAESLNAYLTLPMTDTKLLTSLRESSSTAHKLYTSEQHMHQIVKALGKDRQVSYGEDIPLDRTQMVEWCISRIETWAKDAGMETFKDDAKNGHVSALFGGKVLVMDIDFSIGQSNEAVPILGVTHVKTSYAVPNGPANTSNIAGSASLDSFLTDCLRRFVVEVQKDEESQNIMEAARLGSLIADHMKYLMKQDQLAAREGDNGLRWFNGIDRLVADILEPFATKEAERVASELSRATAPLDILLLRGHSLPLPYLTAPAISFLVHLSPLSYLTLLRAPVPSVSSPAVPSLDIPLTTLRERIISHPRPAGTTVATLLLASSSIPSLPIDSGMQALQGRPSFYLEPDGTKLDATLPEAMEPNDSPEAGKVHKWYLDFTEGGKYPGVIMSQSMMRDIENILNPLGSLEDLEPVQVVNTPLRNWVDLIVNPDSRTSGRYTCVYNSPTSSHPSLLLRLTKHNESGFVLERIPVQSVKQIWGILEIVKEQCWINEILRGCQWTPEADEFDGFDDADSVDATAEDLEAVLRGTVTPRRIPVNVYIMEDHPQTMDASLPTPRRSKIVMTSPERPPITGLVETSVVYDPGRPRGTAVRINGAMGADLNTEGLEEVCRRGGLFSLPGRIWVKAHGYS